MVYSATREALAKALIGVLLNLRVNTELPQLESTALKVEDRI